MEKICIQCDSYLPWDVEYLNGDDTFFYLRSLNRFIDNQWYIVHDLNKLFDNWQLADR